MIERIGNLRYKFGSRWYRILCNVCKAADVVMEYVKVGRNGEWEMENM